MKQRKCMEGWKEAHFRRVRTGGRAGERTGDDGAAWCCVYGCDSWVGAREAK
jgi:hypothetical protein